MQKFKVSLGASVWLWAADSALSMSPCSVVFLYLVNENQHIIQMMYYLCSETQKQFTVQVQELTAIAKSCNSNSGTSKAKIIDLIFRESKNWSKMEMCALNAMQVALDKSISQMHTCKCNKRIKTTHNSVYKIVNNVTRLSVAKKVNEFVFKKYNKKYIYIYIYIPKCIW